MCKLTEGQQWYINDLKAAHAAGFCVMYRPSQSCCWVQCVYPSWSNHPDCYTMEPDERGRWGEYKQTRGLPTTGKPHPHAALIKQWADGAVIQEWVGDWYDVNDKHPHWYHGSKYRVKPQETDLQKYGVEVGDVWGMYSTGRVLVTKLGGTSCVYVIRLDTTWVGQKNKEVLHELKFRRGVVNKL